MNEKEIEYKTTMWMKVNAEYLKDKAEKEEKERVLREEAEKEGKPIKKRAQYKKKTKTEKGHNQTALEGNPCLQLSKLIRNDMNRIFVSFLIVSCTQCLNLELYDDP